VIGFGSGAQPLISQAYGARNFVRCGELLQRQMAIHLLVLIAIVLLWLNTEHVLLTFRQPAHVAQLTAKFVLWRIPALPFVAIKEDFRTYLLAQNKMRAPMAISVLANGLSVAGFFPLIATFGFVGAPLSMTLGNALQAILTGFVAKFAIDHPEAWPRWSARVALRDWGEILSMALPSGALMLCEWWGWEVNLFFAGLLCKGADGCADLNVFPILSNTMVIGFMTHYGFSVAACTRVGNALGAGDAVVAKRTGHLTLWLVGAISGLVAVFVFAVRRSWAHLFTDDEAIVELTGEVMPLIAAYIFLDALGPGALVSLLRSLGIVMLPAVLVFVSFYVIGIPFGLWLTFGRGDAGWGVSGLWAGLVLGMLTMVVCLLTFLLCFVDWRAVAQEAHRKAQAEPAQPAQPEQLPGKVDASGSPQDTKATRKKQSRKYGLVLDDDSPCAAGGAKIIGRGIRAALEEEEQEDSIDGTSPNQPVIDLV